MSFSSWEPPLPVWIMVLIIMECLHCGYACLSFHFVSMRNPSYNLVKIIPTYRKEHFNDPGKKKYLADDTSFDLTALAGRVTPPYCTNLREASTYLLLIWNSAHMAIFSGERRR